ncbi:hypothetical protein BC834DRAFT_414699 [Gloeopeniophorella convolvens]|nr:hypothetical protein BC834DRAFT_414699 [Gloeopeniophorella convolvens]
MSRQSNQIPVLSRADNTPRTNTLRILIMTKSFYRSTVLLLEFCHNCFNRYIHHDRTTDTFRKESP